MVNYHEVNKINERIREFASQLGPIATIGNWGRVEWADNVYPQFGDRLYAAIDLEEFALLIVQECIKQAHSVGDLRGANDDMIYGADTAAVQISKYFGVEK